MLEKYKLTEESYDALYIRMAIEQKHNLSRNLTQSFIFARKMIFKRISSLGSTMKNLLFSKYAISFPKKYF